MGEILDNDIEKQTENIIGMKKNSVDGVKNLWSKALDSFKSKRWRHSKAQKIASEKDVFEKEMI